ncbi:Calx-beta domain-containing protein [Paludisphaera soli]|uniref:Calx-beta domain-containing protein n=1 Tax=Paludisphaera soli TaxID=2712865 RepID=UPI0013EAD04A|nr:Calx-beta domain-containing protein [Paludisphaera soli]
MMRVQQGRARRRRNRSWGLEPLEDRRLLTQYYFPADPNLSLIDLESGPAFVSESAGEATFTVGRSGDVSGPASVRVETRPMQAVPGYDYVPLETTLTFAPGETRATFKVKILDDRIAEPTYKSIRVELSDAVGAYSVGAQRSREVTIADDEPASASPLTYHAFAGAGLWTYNEVEGWRKINDATPEAIVPAPDRGAVLDFGPSGLWAFDELRGYRKLNDVDPRAILGSAWTSDLLVDFGHGGLWTWNEREGYRKINDAVPDAMAGDASGWVMLDFGAHGLWSWSSGAGWGRIRDHGPEAMLVTPGGGGQAYLDYGADGLWEWHPSGTLLQLSEADPETMAVPVGGELYVGFGPFGLWNWSAYRYSWKKVNDVAPRAMATDPRGLPQLLDGTPPPALFLDYGDDGLWRLGDYGAWDRLNDVGPASVTYAGVDDLLLNYGTDGLWRWTRKGGYARLRDVAPTASAVASSAAIFRGTVRDFLAV